MAANAGALYGRPSIPSKATAKTRFMVAAVPAARLYRIGSGGAVFGASARNGFAIPTATRSSPRSDGFAIDFVDESDRAQLSEIQLVRDGRLRTNIGTVVLLDDAVAAFNSTERHARKTVIRVRP